LWLLQLFAAFSKQLLRHVCERRISEIEPRVSCTYISVHTWCETALNNFFQWLMFTSIPLMYLMTISMITRPVATCQGLRGQDAFLGGKEYCFYHIFNKNFSGHNKNLEDIAPELSPMTTGLMRTIPLICLSLSTLPAKEVIEVWFASAMPSIRWSDHYKIMFYFARKYLRCAITLQI